jgi:Ca2+-binding RTX toxin-like protein
MDSASQLDFITYGLAGYESVANYYAEYPIGAADALFTWQAAAGAVYTIQSTSFLEPDVLLIYDQSGNAIFADDGSGLPGSDHATFVAPYSGTYYVMPSWRQGSGQGQHGVTLSVYEDVSPIGAPVIAGSDGGDILTGTPNAENILAKGGADILRGHGGDDYLDGGPGLDTAIYAGARANYDVFSFGDRQLTVDLTGADGRDLMSNMERLVFPDVSIALDIDGAGGKAARIYQAAFNRAPDLEGLGFWIYHLDRGTTLVSVANGFIGSPEFRSIYGESPSNYELVYRFYQNVLHREPDASGFAFWLHALDANIASRAEVLIGFSESPENYIQVIGSMTDGISFIPWG